MSIYDRESSLGDGLIRQVPGEHVYEGEIHEPRFAVEALIVHGMGSVHDYDTGGLNTRPLAAVTKILLGEDNARHEYGGLQTLRHATSLSPEDFSKTSYRGLLNDPDYRSISD